MGFERWYWKLQLLSNAELKLHLGSSAKSTSDDPMGCCNPITCLDQVRNYLFIVLMSSLCNFLPPSNIWFARTTFVQESTACSAIFEPSHYSSYKFLRLFAKTALPTLLSWGFPISFVIHSPISAKASKSKPVSIPRLSRK